MLIIELKYSKYIQNQVKPIYNMYCYYFTFQVRPINIKSRVKNIMCKQKAASEHCCEM